MSYLARSLCLLAVLALFASPALTQAPPAASRALDASDERLPDELRAAGNGVRLEGVDPALPDLELERVSVFTEEAAIRIHADDGVQETPVGNLAFFRGRVGGRPGSRAVLSVGEDGAIHGFAVDGGRRWLLGRQRDGAAARPRLVARAYDEPWQLDGGAPFACDAEALSSAPSPLDVGDSLDQAVDGALTPVPAASSTSYTARVAVETDWELRQKFASTQDLVQYVGDLFNYASSIYEAEVGTSLLVSTVSVWDTSSDPWSQTSTACGLLEFGRWWNDNRAGESRTIAHFLSGKSNGGGIAWQGVLCDGEFHPGLFGFGPSAFGCSGLTPENDNYGGAYGYTGNLFGTFDIDNPSVMWDITAVTHEIGHNFSSPHTHDYCNVGGNANPVDRCASGCAGGAQGLPGPSGQGSGTIMSYCHLLGGYSNLSLTFGTGHPYGVVPERVPSRMRSHVESRAASSASCLAYVPSAGAIFQDGFESGGVSRWAG
jgi:hypothetical protein